MSSGSLNGTEVHIEKDTDWISQPVFAELLPLDSSTTTVHKLSVPSNRRAITAFLLGSVDDAKNSYSSLVTSCNNATIVTFIDDQGDSHAVYIMNINGNRIPDRTNYSIRFNAELLKAS